MSEPKFKFSVDGHDYAEPLVMLWFSAEWCGPCQQMEPIVKKLVNQYREQIRVLQVDVDQQLELAHDFALRGVPTLVLLTKNGEVDRQIGAAGLKQLSEWLDRSLSQLNDSGDN